MHALSSPICGGAVGPHHAGPPSASADALVRQRCAASTVTLIDLLDAERRQIGATRSLSIAEAGLTGDFVAIQKALRLGLAPPG